MVDRKNIQIVRLGPRLRIYCQRCGLVIEPGERHPCEEVTIQVEEERELVAA